MSVVSSVDYGSNGHRSRGVQASRDVRGYGSGSVRVCRHDCSDGKRQNVGIASVVRKIDSESHYLLNSTGRDESAQLCAACDVESPIRHSFSWRPAIATQPVARCAANLAVVIAPSLIWRSGPMVIMPAALTRKVNWGSNVESLSQRESRSHSM